LPCWKLVRDGVARRLSGSGNVVLKRIEREQLRELLRVKIVEEALEFAESGSVEELADLFEAVTEWLRLAGMSLRELEALAEAKRREEGGFSEGWVAFWKDRDAC
jgi:predicted house-cleaning noncanonical NTP pyrophosphatase (MazG superfamily)